MFDATKEEKALKGKKVAELREIAAAFSVEGCEKMKKAELIEALMREKEKDAEPEAAEEAGKPRLPEKSRRKSPHL